MTNEIEDLIAEANAVSAAAEAYEKIKPIAAVEIAAAAEMAGRPISPIMAAQLAEFQAVADANEIYIEIIEMARRPGNKTPPKGGAD